MPASFNKAESSGQISSWRFLYSASKPGNNFILKATRIIVDRWPMIVVCYRVMVNLFLIKNSLKLEMLNCDVNLSTAQNVKGLTFITQTVNSQPSTDNASYRTNPAATPPSTFNTFPVDLPNKPPAKAKQAFAISSG